ncbi:alcohol dehydrogenase-like 1 [Carica papaya]|uniref:alcohol dehydrogenase-like 1 n=1 Tax=Carica papaya TaxID=3649 RepID=UPI000B8CCF2E|nr:alcohol dehydrogenase-like 1 [Carica papaya]
MLNSSSTTSKVITCKAVVCWGRGGDVIKVEDIKVEPPKSNEVRVKMLYASICHTDLLFIEGFPDPDLFPRVLGHEGVGEVESVGEDVTELKEGDLVIPSYIGECQKCENCSSRKSNFCLRYPLPLSGLMLDGTSRMSIEGQNLFHSFSCSTWTEYMLINVNYAIKISPDIPLSHASFLSCGFSTGYGAAWKDGNIERGSSVLVIGLGAVGLGVIQGAKMQGATTIIGVDKNPMKKEKGQVFGMTHFINPDESGKSISDLVKELTGGIGVDCSFQCTGVTSLVTQAIEATKPGVGRTILIGTGIDTNMNISFESLVSGKTLKGSLFGGLGIKSDLPILLDKYINKEIQLDELLSHEISLEDITKGFELLKHPDCVKVLVKI